MYVDWGSASGPVTVLRPASLLSRNTPNNAIIWVEARQGMNSRAESSGAIFMRFFRRRNSGWFGASSITIQSSPHETIIRRNEQGGNWQQRAYRFFTWDGKVVRAPERSEELFVRPSERRLRRFDCTHTPFAGRENFKLEIRGRIDGAHLVQRPSELNLHVSNNSKSRRIALLTLSLCRGPTCGFISRLSRTLEAKAL